MHMCHTRTLSECWCVIETPPPDRPDRPDTHTHIHTHVRARTHTHTRVHGRTHAPPAGARGVQAVQRADERVHEGQRDHGRHDVRHGALRVGGRPQASAHHL